MCDLTKSLKSASTFSEAALTCVSFSLSAATSFSQLTDLSVRPCLLAIRRWCVSRNSGEVRWACVRRIRGQESHEVGERVHQEHLPHLLVGPRGVRKVGQLVKRQV